MNFAAIHETEYKPSANLHKREASLTNGEPSTGGRA